MGGHPESAISTAEVQGELNGLHLMLGGGCDLKPLVEERLDQLTERGLISPTGPSDIHVEH